MTAVHRRVEVLRGYARTAMPRAIFERISRTIDAAAVIRLVGFDGYRRLRRAATQPGSDMLRLDVPTLLHPFWVRRNPADVESVIGAVFREDLGKFLPCGDVRCIIDAGGYIGDSAVWCLSRFPSARVVSIEPDAGNFELLRRNLEPYGERAVSVRAGLWPRPARLRVTTAAAPNALEVEEAGSGTRSDCRAVTVLEVLELLGEKRIDLLKCNIEGAERAVFGENYREWLEITRCIAIQIHDDAGMRVVSDAVRPFHFRWQRYRYLYILQRAP
jgi:FkbM family methyltransferase